MGSTGLKTKIKEFNQVHDNDNSVDFRIIGVANIDVDPAGSKAYSVLNLIKI